MSIIQLEKLKFAFLKLTETNQFYILGLVEGLKHAQGKNSEKLSVKKEVLECIKSGTKGGVVKYGL